ncbi:MAG: class I adenylate-forming enzyme family protein, partial [Acidimicrobiales bacterium]
ESPERIALISDTEGARSYGVVVTGAERFGYAAQHRLGLEVGDRLCIWLSNRFDWFDAYIGASAVGVATVQANPAWSDKEMEFVLRHSRSRALVCEPTHIERAIRLAALLPDLAHVLVVGDDAVPDGMHSFGALLAAAPADARGRLRATPELFVAGLMYTSGTTTGRPKAVAHNSDVQGRQVDYVEMFGVDATDRIMFVTPLFHANAMGAWQCALGYGASAVFQRKFSATNFWSVVDHYRPSVLFTLAPIVNILMGRAATPMERTNRFRVMIVLGSGPNAPAIEQRFGAPIIDWYGMTEAGSGTYTRLGDERRPGSAGRRFPGSTMRVLREDGSEAGPDEVGEVGFRLEDIHFGGYIDDDEANEAAVRDGWFMTGDLGYFDADGYFFFVDRKKDIVRRGGVNISSIEVETVLRAHELVADVAIVAVPDAMLGERIVAFVVCAGGEEPTLEMLRSFAEVDLAHYKRPDALVIVEDLPRTASGKVEKFRLRSLL